MTPEGRVKAKLRQLLKDIGAYQFWPVQTGYGSATIDVLFCHQGKFYGIETKRPEVKKVTPRQECVMRDIAAAGGGVWLENSEDLATTIRMLGL